MSLLSFLHLLQIWLASWISSTPAQNISVPIHIYHVILIHSKSQLVIWVHPNAPDFSKSWIIPLCSWFGLKFSSVPYFLIWILLLWFGTDSNLCLSFKVFIFNWFCLLDLFMFSSSFPDWSQNFTSATYSLTEFCSIHWFQLKVLGLKLIFPFEFCLISTSFQVYAAWKL